MITKNWSDKYLDFVYGPGLLAFTVLDCILVISCIQAGALPAAFVFGLVAAGNIYLITKRRNENAAETSELLKIPDKEKRK